MGVTECIEYVFRLKVAGEVGEGFRKYVLKPGDMADIGRQFPGWIAGAIDLDDDVYRLFPADSWKLIRRGWGVKCNGLLSDVTKSRGKSVHHALIIVSAHVWQDEKLEGVAGLHLWLRSEVKLGVIGWGAVILMGQEDWVFAVKKFQQELAQ